MDRVSVSVLIAAHDEAASIAAVVRGAWASSPEVGEVLVIDDGSVDGTAALAEAADPRTRVLRLPTNQGKGSALRRGIAEAKGEILVFIDGDGQDDPAEIPLLLGAVKGADLVLGSRFQGTFDPGAITPINWLGNRFLSATINALFRAGLTDTQAGFRALRRAMLARIELRADGYDIETDMLLRVLRAGGRVAEVPVRRAAREHGSSDLHSLRDGTRIFRRILQVRFAP